MIEGETSLGDAIRTVAARALDELVRQGDSVQPWGVEQAFSMKNIVFGGKLPEWLGFDSPPIPFEGASGTVVQGALMKIHGRDSNWYCLVSIIHTHFANSIQFNSFFNFVCFDLNFFF